MREIDSIIIHTSYTPPSMDIGVEEIRKWHVEERGWRDVGYHYIIRRNGNVDKGRPLEQVGAHVKGHNDHSIGICLVGGKVDNGVHADCNYTSLQWKSLEEIVVHLLDHWPRVTVAGHRDFAPGRACPCFDAEVWASTLGVGI